MPSTPHPVHETQGFRYVDEGPAATLPPLVLLHGMMGDPGNWSATVAALAARGYRVLAPELPIYDLPAAQTSVQGLTDYLHAFLRTVHDGPVALGGNSLGGHVALRYALQHPDRVVSLVLSGASGIYEVEIGSSTMRRRDRDFIRERAALTFYRDDLVTEDLVERIYHLINDRVRALRLIRMARSVQAETLTHRLPDIKAPTLLIWGRDDRITPPDVAETFARLLPRAELHFLDRCGHAPMMEHPDRFNAILLDFARRTLGVPPRLALSS
ncbi:MAG: alpha/beta hydrolase [Rhodothermaceae bacterium]|nr:MAG: alpha/beta hydrolase [Rhodothermaceae bacterium]